MARTSRYDDCATSSLHPRTIGWLGTTALAMGGSNQSLFLIGALIAGQGSAAVPLLILGLLLSWAAAPGWTELILMWPNRVGGIAATCAEAFRPYSPVLANLTGVCYWWGWVPTCGLTAILSATAISEWYLPGVPVPLWPCCSCSSSPPSTSRGVRWVTRLALPMRHGLGRTGLPLRPHPGAQRPCRLAARSHLSPEQPLPGRLRRVHERDGRPLPDRLRRAGLRGRDLPCRRDDQSGAQRTRAPCSPAGPWPRSTSSCCPWSGSASSAPTPLQGDLATTSAPPSRRCSAAQPRPPRSGS